ncbi:MAG: response regulator transcription factor [Lachnospiraceae bacterium]|jgi:Response regulator of the LytR/AlgR family|nr:response regulator transcription factor [Lachnospiraceae bacterium]
MRIAVCDDSFRDILYMRAFMSGHDVSMYSDAASLLSDLESKKALYDLYLLDIYIDDSMNGIELAKKIRAADDEAAICFISTSDDFYREAYDLYAIQYLVKPVQESDLKQLLEKIAKNLIRNREQCLCYKWRGKTGSIPYGKILYISSREHNIYIHCKDGTVQECKGKLNELASQICGEIFLRCHQSFLANLYHVDNLNGQELTISGQRIPISRRYYNDVKRRYHEILFEEVN